MGGLSFSYHNGTFYLNKGNGENAEFRCDYPRESNKNIINFHRKSNNFGYVSGDIRFQGNCENNLIISDRVKTIISDTHNSLVIINDGSVKISPINEIDIGRKRCAEVLSKRPIAYHIPRNVLKRENLQEKNLGDLERMISRRYGLRNVNVEEVRGNVKKNGIFRVRSSSRDYVFKYIGVERKRVEAICLVSAKMPDLFPIKPITVDGENSIKCHDGLYCLEEFIPSVESSAERDLDYFSRLGEQIGLMHDGLLELLEDRPVIQEGFLVDAGHLSDSNLLALWLDLFLNGFRDLSLEIEKFSRIDLSKRVLSLPECIIHGDLNASNVVRTKNGMKFIDLETFKISRRILEFEAPLIFGGNMSVQSYIPGSFTAIMGGYEQSSQVPLNDEEKVLCGNIVEYALIKNFVIRNIRRSCDENSKKIVEDNLRNLRNDFFHD